MKKNYEEPNREDFKKYFGIHTMKILNLLKHDKGERMWNLTKIYFPVSKEKVSGKRNGKKHTAQLPILTLPAAFPPLGKTQQAEEKQTRNRDLQNYKTLQGNFGIPSELQTRPTSKARILAMKPLQNSKLKSISKNEINKSCNDGVPFEQLMKRPTHQQIPPRPSPEKYKNTLDVSETHKRDRKEKKEEAFYKTYNKNTESTATLKESNKKEETRKILSDRITTIYGIYRPSTNNLFKTRQSPQLKNKQRKIIARRNSAANEKREKNCSFHEVVNILDNFKHQHCKSTPFLDPRLKTASFRSRKCLPLPPFRHPLKVLKPSRPQNPVVEFNVFAVTNNDPGKLIDARKAILGISNPTDSKDQSPGRCTKQAYHQCRIVPYLARKRFKNDTIVFIFSSCDEYMKPTKNIKEQNKRISELFL